MSKMKILAESNDENGTLKITVDPRNYDNLLNVISKTFIGFNKISEYSFEFIPTPSSGLNKKMFKPSEITNEIFYDKFVKYTGFDSSDMELTLLPNDSNGLLYISIELVTRYAQEIIDKTPFKYDLLENKYLANITIDGFKTIDEFNNEFQLVFRNDNDSEMLKVQELTPSEIINAFGNTNPTNSIVVGGKTYTNKYSFTKDFFVKSFGSQLPDFSSSNQNNILIEFYANNSGGEITIKIEYKNINNYDTNLVFIQLFNGFSKGNDVITNDVLVFKNQKQLNSLSNIYNNYPSTISNHLTKNKKDITHF